MKKIVMLCFLVVSFSSFARTPRDIDDKVKNLFYSYFPNAKEVSWYESNDGYMAYFIDQGVQSRILVPKNVSFIRFIRYYKEDHLPSSVGQVIKKKIAGKKIDGITEVTTITQPENHMDVEYNINAEDEQRLLLIKVYENGNIGSVKKLRKASE
jgi:hypothetical protein